jgi:hypothetical protein
MTDMRSDEGIYRLERRLKRMGVFTALTKAGATEGSRIVIGETEFTWDSSFRPVPTPAQQRDLSAQRRRR